MRKGMQFGGGLLAGNARSQAAGDLEPEISSHQRIGLAVGQSREFAEGNPHRLGQAAINSDEVFRSDSDDGQMDAGSR